MCIQAALVILVILGFVVGISIRLHLMPRGEDRRLLDLLSRCYGSPLTHERTQGYYNNDETDAVRGLGVSVLENSHFTKAILQERLLKERIRAFVAFIILVTIFFVKIDYSLPGIAAQAIFSEQIFLRYLRTEWLRLRCQEIYKVLYSILQQPSSTDNDARTIAQFALYEMSKANAGIILSSKMFRKLNPALSREWEEIKSTLSLKRAVELPAMSSE